jgi:hypothetical protein
MAKHRSKFSIVMCLLTSTSAALMAGAQVPSDNPGRTVLDKAVDKAVGESFGSYQHVGLSIGIYDHGKRVF